MSNELVNAEFAQRVVIATDTLPWIPSPQAGVERRLLDRIGSEVARATSLVRYAKASTFPAHQHGLGEEFLVLDGVFSDEHGDYPRGTYVRNPPGSRHTPRTEPGCIILVKLRQMQPSETARIVIDTSTAKWEDGVPGLSRLPLHNDAETGERVALSAWPPTPESSTRWIVPAGRRFSCCPACSRTNMDITARAPGSGTRPDSGAAADRPREQPIG